MASPSAGTSPAAGVEALHDAAPVGARLLHVADARVLADDAPPERLSLDVPRELRHFPLAGERVEHAARDLGADALAAMTTQDEELADIPRAVPREVGAVAHQREAGEHAVGVHEIGRHAGVGPEPLDDLRVAVESVVADRPVVDGGEIVEVELHEAPQDRQVLGAGGAKLDLHGHARLPLMRFERTIIGMVHLAPLPGSPRWEGSMGRVVAGALADAGALVEGGVDAVLVENFNDMPFTPGRVEPATVAAMRVVAAEVRRALPRTPLGLNVLKNDARAALAVAAAVGDEFIRVNVHAGAVLADQGIVQSDAHGTLRDRRLLGADVAIFADVGGKHAVPLGPVELDQTARDLVHRGLADALVVSGPAT